MINCLLTNVIDFIKKKSLISFSDSKLFGGGTIQALNWILEYYPYDPILLSNV